MRESVLGVELVLECVPCQAVFPKVHLMGGNVRCPRPEETVGDATMLRARPNAIADRRTRATFFPFFPFTLLIRVQCS